MGSEKVGGPDDATDLEAAEHVPSRSDSVRPKLRIRLPSNEESPEDSNGPSRMSVDEEKGEARKSKPDSSRKRERGWYRLAVPSACSRLSDA